MRRFAALCIYFLSIDENVVDLLPAVLAGEAGVVSARSIARTSNGMIVTYGGSRYRRAKIDRS